MVENFNSKVPFPMEVGEVSSEAVQILDNENFFDEQFDYPDEAKTLFYEKFGESLIKKFIDGHELMWEDTELGELITLASIEHAVNELEKKNIVDVFEDEDGEKIVYLKNYN